MGHRVHKFALLAESGATGIQGGIQRESHNIGLRGNLQYAREQGCEWHPNCTCSNASVGLEAFGCFKYHHGYELDAATCRDAAAEGHLECLEYAQ